MVATFHLHCQGHRIKYGNPDVGNTIKQFFSATRPCCSYYWIIFVLIHFRHIPYIYIYIYIYRIHHWQILWSSYRKLAWVGFEPVNSVQTLQATELSGHEFNSHSQPTLYSYSNFIVCSVWHFISACLPSSVATSILIKFFFR